MGRQAIRPVSTAVLCSASLAVLLCGAMIADAAPAWGGSCLSCHNQITPSPLLVINHDTLTDPNESATGAPDRGMLKTFHAFRGQITQLEASVTGLDPNDTYAAELKRLRFTGVVGGDLLTHSPDCSWPEWGDDVPGYYTQPDIAYLASTGPSQFTFGIEVGANSPYDYFDLVFAVAGKFAADDWLFYGEEHFYLHVVEMGDVNESQTVDVGDFVLLGPCLGGPDVTSPPPDCDPLVFSLSDLDRDADADLADLAIFQRVIGG